MNMKRLILMMTVVAFAMNADAQGWLKKLGEKAVEKAKEKVEKKVEKTVENKADQVLNGESSSSTSDDGNVDDYQNDTKNAKSDFVPGSVVMFEDNLEGEQIGEFRSCQGKC